ncbi:MAG: IMP dehydrogenase, partial [Bdellovibrionia bacterium]
MDRTALTFDDILLVPQYSEVVPSMVSTATHFARDKNLNVPIISSPMDTVTENKIARRMAQNGGLGIIHKNLAIEAQVAEVDKVKKYESGMITDPITLGPDAPLRQARSVMREHGINGLPIVEGGRVV